MMDKTWMRKSRSSREYENGIILPKTKPRSKRGRTNVVEQHSHLSASTTHDASQTQSGPPHPIVGLNQSDAAGIPPVVAEQNMTDFRATSDINLTEEDDSPDIGIELDIADQLVGNKRKRVRGPTFMPKVWGQTMDEKKSVSFNDLGQPNDEENTSTLAHFLGSIARNGKFCPLHYKDWRLMPYSYKDEMLKIVKAKFDIPLGNEPYVLKLINKKWRSWKSFVKSLKFDPNVPHEQQLSSKPDRVEDEQYKALIKFWMSDKSKAISEKNKQTRAQLELLHRMGKKSYALVREAWKKKYGKYPTQVDLFKEYYFRVDDPRISAVIHETVEHMEQLEGEQEPGSSDEADCIHKSNENFEKVMGKEKNGHVRMFGFGVSRSDIYGPLPSRDASYRLAMEYKEKYDAAIEFKKKYDALSTNVYGGAQAAEKSNHQNVPFSSSNHRRSSASTSRSKTIRVHSRIVLKSLENINEIVASGYISAKNSIRVNGEELGPGWCEINVQCQMRNDVHLIKPYDHIQTIGDSLGAPVAWPLSLVGLDENDD